MDRIILDANAVISLLTDRNATQRNTVVGLTQKTLRGEIKIVLHQHVLSETIFILLNVYTVDKNTVAKMIADLIGHPGAVTENYLSWKDVLDFVVEALFRHWRCHCCRGRTRGIVSGVHVR